MKDTVNHSMIYIGTCSGSSTKVGRSSNPPQATHSVNQSTQLVNMLRKHVNLQSVSGHHSLRQKYRNTRWLCRQGTITLRNLTGAAIANEFRLFPIHRLAAPLITIFVCVWGGGVWQGVEVGWYNQLWINIIFKKNIISICSSQVFFYLFVRRILSMRIAEQSRF